MLLRLLALGLSWREARELGIEDVLCLLLHDELNSTLAALGREADRVASLPLADERQQQRRLTELELRLRAELDRFYRTDAKE